MLVGRRAGDPHIMVVEEALDFGETPLDSVTDLTLTLGNVGGGRLNIQSLSISGNDAGLFSLPNGENHFGLDSTQTSYSGKIITTPAPIKIGVDPSSERRGLDAGDFLFFILFFYLI